MSSPVLVLSNDFSLAAAKTSRHLVQALRTNGRTAVCRDTRLVRWAAAEAGRHSGERQAAYEQTVLAKWNKFIFDYGFDTVVSLDLHWLVSPLFLLPNELVRNIHSLWFDDLRSHLQSAPMFLTGDASTLELINHPKVTHHAYGGGQREELQLLGVQRVRPSFLAAPGEFLDADAPCEITDRLAFIGNPGLPTPPSAAALAAMEHGDDLPALRALARSEVLAGLPHADLTAPWIHACASVADLLADAMQERIGRPHIAALSLLIEAGRTHASAWDYLNRGGHVLDAAMLVKLVNRYDRPALVRRLARRGWLDVFGTPDQWLPYGVTARPTVPFPDLAATYRRYAAHLNAPNCAREASANEKLFEIAACGRVSLNLDSPDVRACYGESHLVFGSSLGELEAAAERVRREPESARSLGEAARAYTAAHHLWEHRLRKVLS
jgi:hypothetical protein